MKLQMAIYAVVGQTTLRQIVALLCYNAAFSHKMHPIVVKLLPKEAPSLCCQAAHTLLVSTRGTVGLLSASQSWALNLRKASVCYCTRRIPQQEQEDYWLRAVYEGTYEEMMRGNNPDSHLRILTIPI